MEVFELLVVAPTERQRLDWVNILGHALSMIVGGFSAYEGLGGWKTGLDGVKCEPHYRIIAYCRDMSAREVFSLMSRQISLYKDNCQQEVVLVVLNGEPIFMENIPETMMVG